MGRIVASVKIENLTDQDAKIRCDALVDTGASYNAGSFFIRLFLYLCKSLMAISFLKGTRVSLSRSALIINNTGIGRVSKSRTCHGRGTGKIRGFLK
jgi:hypothetical protein